MNGTRKLRWGILGCARIVRRAFIPAIEQSVSGTVVAIASREERSAKETALAFGIPNWYGNYDALLRDDTVDAVYIPLPNHLHKIWTIRAAEAGKHVLCEKPFSLNANEALEMSAACERVGVKLAEAFMYRHHPRYARLKEIIKSGEIGTIRGLHGTFTLNMADRSDDVRFHREMGGGAIYDLGVYPISAARYILEAEPEAATVQAYFSPVHDNVDMMAAGLLEFPGSVALTFDCALWASTRRTLEILGTEGRIEIPVAYGTDAGSNFFVLTPEGRREEDFPDINPYSAQVDDFAESVWTNAPHPFGAQDAVRNMRAVEACLRSAREKLRIAVARA